MNHGKANALDSEMLQALIAALDREEKEETRSLVLTGSGKIFSAGVDLFRFIAGGEAYIAEVIDKLKTCLRRVFSFPKPLVAAVNGHAIAGGCILALAADYRVMSEDCGRIGVPELDFGVPLPSVLFEVVRHRVPINHHHEVVFRGGTYLTGRALELGLVDELAPSHSLLHRAVQECERLEKIRPQVFSLTKSQRCRAVLKAFDESALQFDERALEILTAQDTIAVIEDYMDRTVGRRERS